jgi:hypothetical protein
VVSLAPGVSANLGTLSIFQQVRIGYPLFGFWTRPVLGYADANGDGVIQAGEVVLGDSVVFMGESTPNYEASFHTNASFFNGTISLGADIDYQNGLTQYNRTVGKNATFSAAFNDPAASFGEQAALIAPTDYGSFESVSTLRFNSLSIAYRLPVSFAQRFGATALNIMLQGTNLGLHSSYSGKDPNVNAFATGNGVADTGILPQPRTWQLRVNASY